MCLRSSASAQSGYPCHLPLEDERHQPSSPVERHYPFSFDLEGRPENSVAGPIWTGSSVVQPAVVCAAAPPGTRHNVRGCTAIILPFSPLSGSTRSTWPGSGHVLRSAVAGGGVVVSIGVALIQLRAPRFAVDHVVYTRWKPVLGISVPSRRLPGPQLASNYR